MLLKCKLCKKYETCSEPNRRECSVRGYQFFEPQREDICPICGTLFPTDDRIDYIPIEEVKFCYSCGARVRWF